MRQLLASLTLFLLTTTLLLSTAWAAKSAGFQR